MNLNCICYACQVTLCAIYASGSTWMPLMILMLELTNNFTQFIYYDFANILSCYFICTGVGFEVWWFLVAGWVSLYLSAFFVGLREISVVFPWGRRLYSSVVAVGIARLSCAFRDEALHLQPRKHKPLTQCWLNAGPPSVMSAWKYKPIFGQCLVSAFWVTHATLFLLGNKLFLSYLPSALICKGKQQ